jgi:hypothetical protein
MIGSLLGRYHIAKQLNWDRIKGQAELIEGPILKSRKFPFKTGLYRFCENGRDYYICRTPLGLAFPSLFVLEASKSPILLPTRIRIMFGVLSIIFLFLFLVVAVGMAIEELRLGLGALAFLLIAVLLLAAISWLEKTIAFRGFRKYI